MVKIALPTDLPPGHYSVHVNWQALDRLPHGQPLAAAGFSEIARFEIVHKP